MTACSLLQPLFRAVALSEVKVALSRTLGGWLDVAIEEAREGLAEGGLPIGAALFDSGGRLLGRGHNRRVQDEDPSIHAETDAFRNAGRRRSYEGTTLVTTLSPCWYCSGLMRHFGIPRVVVGESMTARGPHDWLEVAGVEVIDLKSEACRAMLADYIATHPDVWLEDSGQTVAGQY
jgi:creatinine deaminase